AKLDRDLEVRIVFLHVLAARGRHELVRFDDPAYEAGIGREQIALVGRDQHAADEDGQVSIVGGAGGGAVLDPQQAACVRLEAFDRTGAELERADRLEKCLEALRELERELPPSKRGHLAVESPRRRRRIDRGLAAFAEDDRNRKERAVPLEERA